MAKCIIVGAGDFNGDYLTIEPDDYIIAADGGFEYLQAIGIRPHVWIGDMDSTHISFAEEKKGIRIIKLPREKDDTDTLSAIRIGVEKGYREFSLYGMLGGRLDHTLANISCLQFLKEQGCMGVLYGKDTVLLLLAQQRIVFQASLWGMLSVFAWNGKAEGVTEQGVMYEIENAVLTPDFPIGVSNELIGNEAVIEVKKGSVLISVIPDDTRIKEKFNDRMFRVEECMKK